MLYFVICSITVPLCLAYFSETLILRYMFIFVSIFTILTVGIQYNYNMFLQIAKMEKEGMSKNQYKKSGVKTKSSSNTRQYEPKTITNKEYDELIKKLKYCMKNKLLTREDVLSFKKEIVDLLNTYNKDYSKFKFENDMHEIYVKLKNKHLNSENYVNLNRYIDSLVKN